MDKFECEIANISKDFVTGKALVTLSANASILPYIEQLNGKSLDCKLSQHKEKRSLSANAYFWVLIGKLQEKMQEENPKVTKDEIYKAYIREYGLSKTFEMVNEAIHTMVGSWEQNGLGWFTEMIDEGIDRSVIRFYYGSSVYSIKRMSFLIDAVVQDCKEMGIETATPDELERMKASWQNQ